MSHICSALLAGLLGVSAQDGLGDWHIWFTTSSGWGGHTGIYVDSSGRNVAYSDSRSTKRLMTDLRVGTPSSFCDKSPLSDDQVRKFAFRISSIPNDVLEKGVFVITGTCADDPRNGVTLRIDGKDLHFGYSQLEFCRNDQEVPGWLTSLVGALQARYSDIKECTETPEGAESRP